MEKTSKKQWLTSWVYLILVKTVPSDLPFGAKQSPVVGMRTLLNSECESKVCQTVAGKETESTSSSSPMKTLEVY